MALTVCLTPQFDLDNDGVLKAAEIADALRSRGVSAITTEQVGRSGVGRRPCLGSCAFFSMQEPCNRIPSEFIHVIPPGPGAMANQRV